MDTTHFTPPRRDPELGVSLTPDMAKAAGYMPVVSPLEHAGPQFWTFQNSPARRASLHRRGSPYL